MSRVTLVAFYHCERCNEINLFPRQIDLEEVDSVRKKMGPQRFHFGKAQAPCSNCGKLIVIRAKAWEYPIGTIAKTYASAEGGGVAYDLPNLKTGFHFEYPGLQTWINGIRIQCAQCSSRTEIAGEDLNCQEIEARIKGKTSAVHFRATWDGQCSSCVEAMGFEIDTWENPRFVLNDFMITKRHGCTDQLSVGFPLKETEFPLFDKKVRKQIGVFEVKADNEIGIKCTECQAIHNLNCSDLQYTWLDGDVMRAKMFKAAAEWRKTCDCGAEMSFIHEKSLKHFGEECGGEIHQENCELVGGPYTTFRWYIVV